MDRIEASKPQPEAKRGRRAYEPPAVQWEEDFQPYVFSTCNKMSGQGGACNFRRSS